MNAVKNILKIAKTLVSDVPLFTGPMTDLDKANLNVILKEIKSDNGKIIRKYPNFLVIEDRLGRRYVAWVNEDTGKYERGSVRRQG